MVNRPNTLFDIHRFFKIDDGCWLWTGHITRRTGTGAAAYGRFWVNNKPIGAHRAMYQYFYGIDPGKQEVCHTCDNPCCLRPSHLFLGTHADNMRDMIKKNRRKTPRGVDNHNSKLTEADVLAIRSSTDCRAMLAEKYQVSQSLISDIVLRKIWKHV